MNRIRIAILSASLILSTAAHSTTYFVNPQAAAPGNGSASMPWVSLTNANTAVRPGDTVILMSGIYTDTIAPARSGSKNAPIVYQAGVNARPILARSKAKNSASVAIDLSGRSYIVIDNITVNGKAISDTPSVDIWVRINNGSYNTIRNSQFSNARGWSGILIEGASKFNRILNNRMDYVGNYAKNYGELINVKHPASSNLIEQNHLTRGGHNLIQIDSYNNIVRNNVLNNDWSSVGGRGAGYRTISLVADYADKKYGYNLFEGNEVTGAGVIPDSPRGAQGAPAMKVSGINQIVRHNFIHRNGQDGIYSVARKESPFSSEHKIYNNVFYQNGGPSWALKHMWDAPNAVRNIVVMNNIMYNNVRNPKVTNYKSDIYLNFGSSVMPMDGLQFRGNSVYRDGQPIGAAWVRGKSLVGIDRLEKQYPSNFSDNLFRAPGFRKDRPMNIGDLALQEGSPLVDAGVSLTATVNSGSGTSIRVEDAGFFTDGFGIIDGDRIVLGTDGQTRGARIVNVDYERDIIDLDRSLSWTKGEAVNLLFEGAAPDIGATEVRRSSANLVTPRGLVIERPGA